MANQISELPADAVQQPTRQRYVIRLTSIWGEPSTWETGAQSDNQIDVICAARNILAASPTADLVVVVWDRTRECAAWSRTV